MRAGGTRWLPLLGLLVAAAATALLGFVHHARLAAAFDAERARSTASSPSAPTSMTRC